MLFHSVIVEAPPSSDSVNLTLRLLSNCPSSQHDSQVLSRESDILTGWERLHPPPEAPSDMPTPSSPPPKGAGGTEKKKMHTATSPNIVAEADVDGNNQAATERDADVGVDGVSDCDGDNGGGDAVGGRRRKKRVAVEAMMR